MAVHLSRPKQGKYFSEGSRLLWAAIQRKGWRQSELAEHLGTTSGQVNNWLYGGRGVSMRWAMTIRSKLRIPLTAWGVVVTKPFVFPERERAAVERKAG